MQKTMRYVRRNLLDHVLIALPILLLAALLCRGLSLQLFSLAGKECSAEVSFVIRSVDKSTLATLRFEGESDFRVGGNTTLKNARLTGVTRAKEVVTDKDGNLTEVESRDRYDVTFLVETASGYRARDGAFLLEGGRCLAQGDCLPLICGDAQYTADFVKVRILS